jgi:cysteine desulfurase / selenocysteine lyase
MPWAAHNAPNPRLLDADAVRAQFPLLNERVGGLPLFYLDNAATSHKPLTVLAAIDDCFRHHYGPIHRGLYALAEDASLRYEQARAAVARFIGAPSPERLIFTRSATESINLVAQGWAEPRLRAGDEVWVTRMEHHSNYLPWQRVCQSTGAHLRIIELLSDGRLDFENSGDWYDPRTRIIALTHVSNVLGAINPIREVVERARTHGIPVLVDAAQSVAHVPVNVAELGCDFLAFSAHKMCGPTGIGALYAKPEHLDSMEPLLVGGGMVDEVGESRSRWAPSPGKFEAGSPNLAGAVGFAAAVDYLAGIGMDRVQTHVRDLTQQALHALNSISGVEIYGARDAKTRAGIIAFNLTGIHPHDVAQLLAERGVAIRAGHHCCQPLMRHLGVPATARASFALYNRPEDVNALIEAVHWARQQFD